MTSPDDDHHEVHAFDEGGPLQPAAGDPYHRIEPLPEIILAISDLPADKPVALVSVTRHHPGNLQKSRDAYFAWGKVYQSLLGSVGASHAMAGRVLSDLYDEQCPWHEMSVSKFDRASDFLTIALSEATQDAMPVRRAGMVDSWILIVEDLEDI